MTAPVQVGPSSQHGGPTPFPPRLTRRHLQILHLAANGYTNREIGRRLGTTEDTVKSQMAVILRRLHVEDRTQAVAVGIRLRLVDLDEVTVSPRPVRVPRVAKPVEKAPATDDLDDELADIGDRVRAERLARGWTETELARRANVSRVTVRRIQDGVGPLRAFVQICSGLRVDMGYLLSDQWVMPERKPSLTEAQVRILSAVADGRPIAEAAADLNITPEGLSSVLTQVYRRLGVTQVPRGVERRAAAVRVAVRHGLLDPEIRTS
ncbi:LuxR C-terminal-related transcriptional regulator [Streptomyces olivaceoviridis]|uniref:LuxR C-terminal-related transcriptional regulator n=1 Tax=Streptomyces olivaceoviridis TaxID=1921 RepID=UPI00368F09E6